MESRRIVLLTEGYLNGWLDFTAKTPLSRTREEYILAVLERKCVTDALRLKASNEASIVSGALSAENLTKSYNSYNKYLALTLPYLKKRDIIKEDSPVLSKEQVTDWKKFLEEKKKWAATLK